MLCACALLWGPKVKHWSSAESIRWHWGVCKAAVGIITPYIYYNWYKTLKLLKSNISKQYKLSKPTKSKANSSVWIKWMDTEVWSRLQRKNYSKDPELNSMEKFNSQEEIKTSMRGKKDFWSVGETFLVDGGVWFKLKTVLTSESKVGATASCLGWELV